MENLRPSHKSDLSWLEDVLRAQSEAANASCDAAEGAAIVQMLKPDIVKTFPEYTHQVVLLSQLKHISCIDGA